MSIRKALVIAKFLIAVFALVGALWFVFDTVNAYAQSVDADGYPSGIFNEGGDNWYNEQNCCGGNDTQPQTNNGGGGEVYNY